MLFLVALGAWMVELSYLDRWQPGALRWHRNLGLVVFALAAIHLSRRLFRSPPPPVAGLREWEKSAAQTAHAALWFLMFALPTSGYFISTSAGAGIDFFRRLDDSGAFRHRFDNPQVGDFLPLLARLRALRAGFAPRRGGVKTSFCRQKRGLGANVVFRLDSDWDESKKMNGDKIQQPRANARRAGLFAAAALLGANVFLYALYALQAALNLPRDSAFAIAAGVINNLLGGLVTVSALPIFIFNLAMLAIALARRSAPGFPKTPALAILLCAAAAAMLFLPRPG